MPNENLVSAVEMAVEQNQSEASMETCQPEIPVSRNIVEAIRNAIDALNIPAPLKAAGGVVAAVVPFGLPVAAAALSGVLLYNKIRGQSK